MLTDLSFLEINSIWPPQSEQDRLDLYCKNQMLFEGQHAEVYQEQFKRIERVIGNFNEVVSYVFVANFQKLISLKVADLLLGEPPKITSGEDPKGAEQQLINDIIERSDLHNTSYEGAIDVSRFGTGLLHVYDDGGGAIGVMRPNIWFPVVDPMNIKKTLYHVLAWIMEQDENNREKTLHVQIHSKGSIDHRQYLVKDGRIKVLIEGPIVEQTGLSDFAIRPINNIVTSDRVCGIDDYTDLDSIIAEILIRCSQIAKVLDKFSNPSMTGPQSALEYDQSAGVWKVKVGSFFLRENKEDAPVEYITWDADLKANFEFIEKAINLLHNISEVGALIFADQLAKTGDITGPGMKKLMMQALAKVNRIRLRYDPALKKALSLATEIGSRVRIAPQDISITWQDGLPEDTQELMLEVSTLYGAGLMSLETALKRLGFEGDALQDEMARIKAEKQESMISNPEIKPRISLEPNNGAVA